MFVALTLAAGIVLSADTAPDICIITTEDSCGEPGVVAPPVEDACLPAADTYAGDGDPAGYPCPEDLAPASVVVTPAPAAATAAPSPAAEEPVVVELPGEAPIVIAPEHVETDEMVFGYPEVLEWLKGVIGWLVLPRA